MSESISFNIKPSKQVIILLSAFAVVSTCLHLFNNLFTAYGIFRDEFYYIACSNRLDAGYVDHPPFSIFMLYLSRNIFGESLFALRIFPSVLSGLTVFITGLLTFRMGGQRSAIILSCLAIMMAPIFIAMNSIYSMNSYDYFFWIAAVYVLIVLIQSGNNNYWYLFGVIAGLGLLNKIGFLWLGAGVFLGLLLTHFEYFRKKEIYIAGLVALLIFSPFIFWNITHDFAHLEFIRNATEYKYSGLSRLDFIAGQFLLLSPINFVVGLTGLYFFLFTRPGKKYRIIGIIYLTSFIILLVNGKSKPEYLGPAYAALFSGGSIFIVDFFKKKYPVTILSSLIVLSGILFMPIVLPVLPVETFIEYKRSLGIDPGNSESKELNELPQFYADMFGWENMAKTVSDVYQKLSPEDQKKAVIFADNYGKAGAIEYYNNTYPLPPVISPHNNYWYWLEEAGKDFEIIIVIGGDKEDHLESCGSVSEASVIKHKYAMPYESNLQIYICRKLKKSVNEIWNESKKFI